MKTKSNAHHVLTLLHTGVISLWTLVGTIVFGTLAITVSFFSKTGDGVHWVARQWARSILWVSGIRVTIKGPVASLLQGSYIFMSNHESNFDIPVLLGCLPIQFRWLAKAELFKIPIFGASMRGAGYISIDRSNRQSSFQSLDQAARHIRTGTSVMIFPEGTRSRDGKLLPFKKGGFVMAVDSGVPIVPLVVKGTHTVMPKKRLIIERGAVILEILPPIETAKYTRKTKDELMRCVRSAMVAAKTSGAPGSEDG